MSNSYSDNINNALNEIYASINTISERFNNSVTLNNQYMEQIQQIQNKLNVITQNEQNNQVQQQTTNQSNNVTPSVETSLPENKDQTQFPDIPSPPVAQPFYQQQNQVSLLNNNVQPQDQYQNLLPITDQEQLNQLYDIVQENQSQQNQTESYSSQGGLSGGYARKKSSKKKRLSFKQKTVKRRNHKKKGRKHS